MSRRFTYLVRVGSVGYATNVASSTVEQYIKTIFHESARREDEILSMKHLSRAMGVAPGTATAMVKHLAQRQLITYVPRRGVILTLQGQQLAITIIRRHRLIETFLEQVLGYDWGEVHDDAERLEHAVSDRFIERLDAYLGHPQADPHGAPIPTAQGEISAPKTTTLDQQEVGGHVTISRVDASDPHFLELLKDNLVTPGEVFVVEDRNDLAGTISLRHEKSGNSLVIGTDQGTRIHGKTNPG